MLKRRTIRTRIAVAFGCVFFGLGGILLGGVYLLTQQGADAQALASGVALSTPAQFMPMRTIDEEAVLPADTAMTIAVVSRQVSDAVARQQLMWSGVALVATAAFAGVVGWWTAGRLLRPVHAMASAARRISASNLDERLNVGPPRDELTELGETVDDLLDRLQSAFEIQRQFVANASHELRTPLATQRALIQVGLRGPDPAHMEQVCQDLLTANRRSEQLIDSLILLARGQHGVDTFEPVDLDGVVVSEIQTFVDATEMAGVSMHLQHSTARVHGDQVLLRHLVRNLVSNAITYNHPGGAVPVEVDGSRLEVRNTGPQLDNENLAELLEPFRRGTRTRLNSHGAGGSGLGLSIAKAIVSAHGGSIALNANSDGGLTVRVHLGADNAGKCA